MSSCSDEEVSDSESSDLLKTIDNFQPVSDIRPNSGIFSTTIFMETYYEDLVFFPESITFPPIYPNSIAYSKLLLTNPGINTAFVELELNDTICFTINQTELSIPPGGSQSLIVTFQPKSPGEKFIELIIRGNSTMKVPILGKCLESPIDLTPQDDPSWNVFKNEKSTITVNIENKNLVKAFQVSISTNSSAFSLENEVYDIAPAETLPLIITFNPDLHVAQFPRLTLRCDEIGQKISRVFNLCERKPVKVIDFGLVAEGEEVKRKVTLPSTENLPKIEPPFDGFFSGNVFTISFRSNEIDQYKAIIELEQIDLEVIAESIILPYDLDQNSLRIRNITSRPIKLLFQIAPNTLKIEPEELTLQGKSGAVLDILRLSTATGIITPNLTITYKRDDGLRHKSQYQLPDLFEIPIPEDDDDTMVEFEEEEEEDIDETLDLKSIPQIIVHPSFIPFFQMTNTITKASTFFVSGCDDFELQVPKWLKVSQEIDVEMPIEVACPSLPSSVVGTEISISSAGYAKKILPILAYKGKSDVHCPEKAVLIYSMDDHYTTEVTVENDGDRLAFVLLTAAEDTKYNVRVNPIAAVIRPNSSEIFEFVVDSEPTHDLNVPIIMYSGDEILRQMKASISPTDFFSVAFQQVPVIDEIEPFREYLSKVDAKEYASFFKKMVQINKLTLQSSPRSATKRIMADVTRVDFFNTNSSHFQLMNASNVPLAFSIYSLHKSVLVEPANGVIRPYSESQILVQLKGPLDSTSIEIRTEDGGISIPVTKTKSITPYQIKKNVFHHFKIDQEYIDFGICDIGGVRKINVKLTNFNDSALNVIINSHKKSWRGFIQAFVYPPSIQLNAFEKTEMILEFHPSDNMKYKEVLLFNCNGDKVKLKVEGQGVTMRSPDFIGTESKSLEFPVCEVGRIKRGVIKVMNKSNRQTNITVLVTPPFVCTHQSVDLEAKRYVDFPVHFVPKVAGSFNGIVRFKSSASDSFAVQLRGTAIDSEF